MQRFSTRFQLLGTIFFIALFALISLVTLGIYQSQGGQMHDLFIAQNAVYIQQLPINAREYYERNDNGTFRALRENVNKIERTIKTIEEGGEFVYFQQNYFVKRIRSEEVLRYTKAFLKEFEEHKKQLSRLLTNNVSQGTDDEALLKLKSQAAIALTFLEEKNNRLLAQNQQLAQSLDQYLSKQRTEIRVVLISTLIGIILLSILLVLLLFYSYFIPMRATLDKIERLAESDLSQNWNYWERLGLAMEAVSQRIEEATEFAKRIGDTQSDKQDIAEAAKRFAINDSLGQALLEMQGRLKVLSEEEQRQQWFNDGIAKVSNILNDYQQEGMETLTFEFLRFLVQHLKANQGGVFFINDTDKLNVTIDLTACYAFDKKKYVTKRIEPNQGLIGECIAEKKSIRIENAPDSFINITSGLGTAPPNSVVIAPIASNEQVFGAVELASFHTFEEYQLHFLEDVCERLASVTSVMQMNHNTHKLLEHTTQINQELQIKEEEMGKNARKLEETQLELNNKLRELEEETNLSHNIVEAINKTSATVEFDMQGNIINVNDMYLSIMGYSEDELVSMNEKLLVPSEESDTQRYQLLWDSLREGSFISGEYKRIDKQGKEVWLNGTYNPIFDIDGKAYKVIQIAQFTTEEKEKDLDYTGKISAISASFPMLDIDNNGLILSGNPQFVELLGFKRREFRKKAYKDFIHIESISAFQKAWEEAIDGESASRTFQFLTKSRQIRHCLVNINPIHNLSGKINKVMILMVDISEQKELENRLTKQRGVLSSTVSELENVQKDLQHQKIQLEIRARMLNKAAFIFEMDEIGNLTMINNSMSRRLKKHKSQMISYPFSSIVHPEFAMGKVQHILEKARKTALQRDVIHYKSEGGDEWWGDTTIALVKEPNQPSYFIGIVFDITQQVINENQLRTSLAQEKARNAIFRMKTPKAQSVFNQILEQLNAQSDNEESYSLVTIINNDYLPTILIDREGSIKEYNALASTIISQASQPVPKMVVDIFEFEADQAKQAFIQKINEGHLAEHAVRLKGFDQPDSDGLRALSIPIFSGNGTDFQVLMVLMSQSEEV